MNARIAVGTLSSSDFSSDKITIKKQRDTFKIQTSDVFFLSVLIQ